MKEEEKHQCYYDDENCWGEVVPVYSFKEYLCEGCKEQEDSCADDDINQGGHEIDI